jgi:hypothetical protein
MRVSLEQARAAKRSPTARRLSQRPQVNGIGITKGADGYALRVDLVEPVDRAELPEEIEGVPVAVDVVGRARPA